jgi:hypothetical protein
VAVTVTVTAYLAYGRSVIIKPSVDKGQPAPSPPRGDRHSRCAAAGTSRTTQLAGKPAGLGGQACGQRLGRHCQRHESGGCSRATHLDNTWLWPDGARAAQPARWGPGFTSVRLKKRASRSSAVSQPGAWDAAPALRFRWRAAYFGSGLANTLPARSAAVEREKQAESRDSRGAPRSEEEERKLEKRDQKRTAR